mmetsp:Transcript_3396/g.5089  ORF Transcript_3396/g.5089 Transcript_3396/m.5089 type:complete len:255 (+) Transcript_3396:335-1099(+)
MLERIHLQLTKASVRGNGGNRLQINTPRFVQCRDSAVARRRRNNSIALASSTIARSSSSSSNPQYAIPPLLLIFRKLRSEVIVIGRRRQRMPAIPRGIVPSSHHAKIAVPSAVVPVRHESAEDVAHRPVFLHQRHLLPIADPLGLRIVVPVEGFLRAAHFAEYDRYGYRKRRDGSDLHRRRFAGDGVHYRFGLVAARHGPPEGVVGRLFRSAFFVFEGLQRRAPRFDVDSEYEGIVEHSIIFDSVVVAGQVIQR